MQPIDVAPREEYAARLRARTEAHARFDHRFRAIGNARLATVILAAALAWFAFSRSALSPAWLMLPVLAFTGLMIVHERIVKKQRNARRAVEYYERGLGRLDEKWHGAGVTGERFRNPEHPYAEDLDLFGKGSLFELMCTARTRAGEEILAQWLTAPALAEEVTLRHDAIRELRGRLDLREDLALLGAEVRAGVHPDELGRWAAGPQVPFSRLERFTAALLAAAAFSAIVAYFLGVVPDSVLIAVFLIELLFAYTLRPRVLHVIASVELPARDLSLLAGVLARFEREQFSSERLAMLRKQLATEGLPASRQIARLNRLIELLDSGRNQFFTPIARPLLWGTQFAIAIEFWRRRSGSRVPAWLSAIGEFEALCSIASYAYEHPSDTLPELSSDAAPLFDAVALSHPLIPIARAVPNHVRLNGRQILIVSGSNMSGKSTLLRSVGINAVLAWAGAPVRAGRLQISALAIGASIRVQDSLQDNRSRFYAEILRLKQIVSIAGETKPLLFLLDELLSGTNSHDRRIGAEAIVRSLAGAGAIGLVTTHDLALAHITESLGGRAENVHFEDHLEGGEIRFDYIMKPGVVERSNALELMRAIGLEV